MLSAETGTGTIRLERPGRSILKFLITSETSVFSSTVVFFVLFLSVVFGGSAGFFSSSFFSPASSLWARKEMVYPP